MWKVHADVLKMAKTEEKRQRIKWFHARRAFFNLRCAQGLEFARHCDHEDARLLVSLFPNGAPRTSAEAAAVFLAKQDDARCLLWAAMSGGQPRMDLIRRSAQGGCAAAWDKLAEALWAKNSASEAARYAEMAVVQDEPWAMWQLASRLWYGQDGFDVQQIRAEELWLRGSELGDPSAQAKYAKACCAENSLERFVWLRRAALQESGNGRFFLVHFAPQQVELHEKGASGRIVFEIGFGLSACEIWRNWADGRAQEIACERAVSLYQQWCAEARQSVMCWIWAARRLGIAKDVRLLIADLVWDERSAWSENKRT